MSIELDSLEIRIQSSAEQASRGIDKLSAALSSLKNITKGGAGLTAVVNQLSKLNTALGGITLNTGKIGEVSRALNGLADVQKASGLTATVNALKKLPAISNELEAADLNKFASQMERVAKAVRPLAAEMQKVSSGFSAFPIRIQKLISSNAGLAASNKKTGVSFGFLGSGISSTAAKFGIYAAASQRVARVMSEWVDESNRYVEDLNLFTVAMGKEAQAAYDYAQAVHDALGIDPAEWMRNQGVFKQITSGFGVVEEKANLMSKNLTQIGYDISSFFNIPIDDAMQKVQSGIAGELEPLRRLGYALDQATLQEIAYKHGIDMKITAMNQAQKSQLRYLSIMEQSGNVMGDMARTIMTPANAMRILGQQITQLKRALGNVLIPALMAILPYIQAFVELLTEAIQRLAVLVGFELPEIDYSSVGGLASGAESAEEALGGAADAAKKLKNATLGIDELNILPEQTSAGGGTGGGGVGGGDLGIDLPEYNFLAGLKDQPDKIKKKMVELLGPISKIGTAFAAWKIGKSLLNWFKDLKAGRFNNIDKLSTGITLMITGFSIEAMGAYDIGYSGPNLLNVAATALGAALGITGSLLVFGTGPLGWAIGIGAALTVGIVSFKLGYDKAKLEADMKSRFGEIGLTSEQIAEWAGELTTSDLAIKLNLYIEEKETLDLLKDQVEQTITELNGYNFRVELGLEIEESSYKAAIDAYVSGAQEYVQQKQVVSIMAVNILLEGTEIGNGLTDFATEFYGQTSGELERLGRELKDVVATGFKDGKWIPDKFEEAVDLQNQIQEILDYISTVEFEAKLTALRLDANGTDLTVESFQDVLAQAQSTIQGQMETLGDVRLEALKVAKIQFDQNILNGMSQEAAQSLYNAAVEAADAAFRDETIELNSATFNFGIETIKDAFATELSAAEPIFSANVQETLSDAFKSSMEDGSYIIGGSVSDFIIDLQKTFKFELNSMDITPEARQNLESLLTALEPTEADLTELAANARAAGEKVPEFVAQGLNDINQLKAIADNGDGILYSIGQKLSTDPLFLDTLATAKDAGYQLDQNTADGLLNNLQVVEDAANGTITLINDTIGEKTFELTPTVVQNLKDLGVNLSDGLLEGAEEQMDENSVKWTEWARGPYKKFKKINEINSPSRTFKALGAYISDGLWDGINGKKTSLFGNIGNWASGILNKVKSTLGIHSPSSIFRDEVGLNIGLGVAKGLSISTRNVTAAADMLMEGLQDSFGAVEVPVAVSYHNASGYATMPERESLIGSMSATFDSPDESGIQTGIAEQNALLRRQNEILMALFEKNEAVYLDSREITDRQAEVSRLYGR